MDEYDEMYGIEDDFEQQFADELEVMAEMERESPRNVKVSELRSKKQTFEEALTSADSALPDAPEREEDESLSESLTPKAKKRKQDVVKKLHFEAAHEEDDDEDDGNDDITPQRSEKTRSGFSLSLSPDRSVAAGPLSVLDISGLEVLQESPKRAAAPRHALKRPPASGDFITVTDCTGNRVYLRKNQDQDQQTPDPRFFRNSQNALGLLAVPVEVLKEQVSERRHRQLVEESQRLTELLNSGIDPELLVDEVPEDTEDENANASDESSVSRLWVDRFAPQHYMELLSDDFTNRCLLKWLKLWDSVVFGRERKPRPPTAESRANSTSAQNQNQNQNQNQRFKTKSQITEEILEAELDQYKRPKLKVALLSGPPGLGKTTLAHIIAKHAGYNVVEINASDDRSAELFQKRIDTATQMKSVLGANEKPNCLIIDEIDGAPAAAISVLLATVNRKDSREGEDSTSNPLKKKKKKESVLLRPIICICNDLYTPALRPLRQQAFLLTFPPTQQSRLTQRLAEITRRQGMKADTGSLMALCEKTDNDIRACINTLQFLHGRGQRQLDQRVVNSMSIGLKDQNKGLFSVWQEIFQLPRLKRKRIGGDPFGGFEEAGLKDRSQRLQHILHLASSSGEHEKLTQGLYDNFLSMKLKDPSLTGVCSGMDWLCFSDLVNECVLHGQNYSLMRYLPFLPAAFHHLFAANSVPRISYPNSHYESLTKTQHTKNALVAMLAEIPPSIRSRVCQNNLCLDVLSLLLELICPKLRPVNPQLYSTREKQQLCELIDTMINYNLTYRQERTAEGQYTYILEPNIEDVVRFPGLPPRRQLTYQVKQLIARETDLERMRRVERAQQRHNPQKMEKVEEVKEVKKPQAKKQVSRNHQQRLENIVKEAVVESKPEMDFFGRAVVPKEKPAANSETDEDGKSSGSLQIGKAVGNSDVWFRFNEGVSNAVRRNVYIRELL
ncbi:chromosome transmission fidelity protein 18 homolog isoform X2 [Pangasianodon hypophthalmus]|uniref:chromosome transmission fidelity protein 18 homolog isoform X2 n=1 Tax=Pangasianodon hypophthalmus TaxID=310915 RepID=UPI0023073FED|nr:chromosome transmission fidelity protein 18 homolog isoform X2 [Pangasianodon hypophthalmus]